MECRIVDLQDLAYGFLDADAALRVRDHVADCARCRADFARLEAERNRLAGAIAGLLWLLIPRSPAPVAAPADVVAVPAAQEKKGAKESVPDTEEALQKEIA